MDWKKIMNKKVRQADGAGKAAGQPAEQRKDMEAWKETEEFFKGLLPELNLRLLLETDSSPRILWVESITITAYEAAPVLESPGNWNFFIRLFKKRRLRGADMKTSYRNVDMDTFL